MHQPLISIIITVLNGAETIGQCLTSFSKQTFTDFEVIIVDGGSTDRTVAIANESRVANKTVYVEPGLGLYAGLNKGIKLSTGKWLYFIGCDDELYSPDTLQQVANVLRKDDGSTKVFVGSVQCVKQENLLRARFGSPYFMRYQVHHQGMFYDRTVFDNLLYDENRRIASDYELNLKLALNQVPHRAMNNIIVCNFGGDGISENQARRGHSEMQEIHKQLFSGVGRNWILAYSAVQHRINMTRKRFNLINLKVRFRRFIGLAH